MPVKTYLYVALTVIASAAISYHVIKVSRLKNKISNLEIETLKQQHRYVNCQGNLLQVQNMLDKQNEALKKISDDQNKKLQEAKNWMDRKDENKYNQQALDIFKSTTADEIVKKLNNLNYNDL